MLLLTFNINKLGLLFAFNALTLLVGSGRASGL